VDASGKPILLFDQNRAHWDQLLIGRGFAALDRSEKVRSEKLPSENLRSEKLRSEKPRTEKQQPEKQAATRFNALHGPYVLQAEIAACHARARTPEETAWPRIATLYAELAQLAPSPVVELNRAVAVGMAFGPAAGLELVDALATAPSLESYHLLPSVRGDLLKKLGRFEEARREFERAASLTRNARERDLLLERTAECI
jgi:predicted RNA polymerase sigma factor